MRKTYEQKARRSDPLEHADTRNKGIHIPTPISDGLFDGKQPREVIETMSRAKRWLESRGYEIKLSGEYKEVKIHTIKF